MVDLASLIVFPLFLIFIRVGTAMMLFPGLSDPSITVRARLLAAVAISLVLMPIVGVHMPPLPESTAIMFMYMLVEAIVGLLMALGARIFMAAINVAGDLIAFTSGLQAATLFDPVSGSNTTAPSLLLGIMAAVLIFATNLHHVLIEGLVQSYQVFPAGSMPPLNDSLTALIHVVARFFIVGVKLAAPVMVIGFLGYVSFGIFNRLIPQLHVFFVALPLSISVGFFILAASIASILTLFMTELHNNAILFAIEIDE